MSNTIQIKRGVGKPDSLEAGELAIDTDTGALYSLVGGVVTEINEPPEGVDLSDYIDRTKRNDVVEGSFQIHWDDSSDQTFPFNGRIGYNGTAEDPNSVEGSFLYASGTRGTFSIGRDGDVELHGPSEIQGMPDRNDERPWITGFSYVQAADFLDADGNSIVGGGGESIWRYESDFKAGGWVGQYYPGIGDDVYVLSEEGEPSNPNATAPWQMDRISVGGVKAMYVGEPGLSRFSGNRIYLERGSDPSMDLPTLINKGATYTNSMFSVENTVLGGINITAAEADRPEELPYSLDEKSIQYALSVTHETLGRTVEIDKDGTIRALAFTDMEGNPIGGGDTSNLMSKDSLNQCYGESWGVIGEGFEWRTNSITTNRFWKHIFQEWFIVASSSDPDDAVFRLVAGGGPAYFNCAVQATDFLDKDGNSIIGGVAELPGGAEEGSLLTWQSGEWKPSQKYNLSEYWTNEINANDSGITLAATGNETKLKLTSNGFEFSHGYEPARVWIKKNDYESEPSQLFVDQIHATDFLDADGNSIVQPPVDLTGYATEAYVGQQIAAIPPPAVPDNVTSATRLKSYEHGLVLGSSPGFGGNNLFVLGSDVNGAYESRVMMGNGLSQQFSIM